MSYLPKNPGSEEETADHTENVSLTITFTGWHKHNSINQAHFIYLDDKIQTITETAWTKQLPSCAPFIKPLAVLLLCSLIGRFWMRTCLVPDKTSSCLHCHLAGRSGKTISEELSMSIMLPEPPSGSDPQCSKRSHFSHYRKLLQCWWCVVTCVPNRDSDVERQRRQSNSTEGEHTFISRRQISDPDENNTRESPEVI